MQERQSVQGVCVRVRVCVCVRFFLTGREKGEREQESFVFRFTVMRVERKWEEFISEGQTLVLLRIFERSDGRVLEIPRCFAF